MHRRLIGFLLLAFLAVIGVNWPELPFNARLADLIFVPLAIAVIAMGAPRMTWRRSDLAVAIYLLGALPAIAASSDPRQSSMEFVREVYLAAIYIVFAIAVTRGFAKVIGMALAIGGALLSFAGLAFVVLQVIGAAPWPPMGEVMQLPYLGNTLRLRALTASEAMLACVLTAAVPFAITACSSKRVRSWCLDAAVMILAAALTFSHAIAGFAVAAVIAIWPALAPRAMLRRAAVGAAVTIVLALNFAATISIRSVSIGDVGFADTSSYHHAIDSHTTRLGDVAVTYDVMSYARIKQVAWRAFIEHPIAGIGLDRFHSATIRAFEEGALPSLYREIDPHSALLGRMAECGIIGGITLMALWIVWAGMAREVSASPIGYAAGAALAGLIVSSLNADVMNFRFVWVLAGLMRGLQEANGMVTASGRGESETTGTR
jgi:O-Antigen ligase